MNHLNSSIRGASRLFRLFLPLAALSLALAAQTDPDRMLLDLSKPAPGNQAILLAPGLLSTPLTDFGLTCCPDGDDLYSTVSAKGKSVIVWREWLEGAWREPKVLPFCGRFRDSAPTIGPDGKALIFTSDRPLNPGDASADFNLWMVERTGDGWGEPHPLTAVNGESQELFPYWTDQDELYFTRIGSAGTPPRIWRTAWKEGGFAAPEPLRGALLTPQGETCASLSPDGKFLLVEISQAPGGLGKGDLYISRRQPDGTWGAPANLGGSVNSDGDDCYAFFSRGGKFLIFMSNRLPVSDLGTVPALLEALFPAATRLVKERFDLYWVSTAVLDPFIK